MNTSNTMNTDADNSADEQFQLNTEKVGKTVAKFQQIVIGQSVLVLLCLLGAGYAIYYVFETTRQSIYVVTSQGTFKAEARQGGEARAKVEINHWANTWAKQGLVYTYENYEQNVGKALEMMNKQQGTGLESHLASLEVLPTLKKYRAQTTVKIDSLVHLPKTESELGDAIYKVRLKGRQVFKFGGDVDDAVRKFGYLLTLRPITRTEKNPFGLIVVKFEPLEVKKTKTITSSNQ